MNGRKNAPRRGRDDLAARIESDEVDRGAAPHQKDIKGRT